MSLKRRGHHPRDFAMTDHRIRPTNARRQERADNAGFAIVIALGGLLALGVLAFAMSTDTALVENTDATNTVAFSPDLP